MLVIARLIQDSYGILEDVASSVELKPNTQLIGDTMATIMGWIGDVAAGGGTAFSEVGVAKVVQPTKGSVAFWYDLDAKGKSYEWQIS